MIEITVDFETYSGIEGGIDRGAWNYSHHESTLPLILSYKIGDGETLLWEELDGYDLPEILVEIITTTPPEELRVIAHNYWFEYCIWKFCCVEKFGWPPIPDSCWFDTMQQCGMAAVPLALEKATAALNVKAKLEQGKAGIKLFSIPNSNGERNLPQDHETQWESLKEYAIGDVDSTREIYLTIPKFKPRETEFIHLSHQLNCTGIPVDVESARIILDKVEAEKATYTTRISELTNGVITTVNQTQRMQRWLEAHHNLIMPNFQAATVESALNGGFGPLTPEAEQLLEMRFTGGKSSTKKYQAIIDNEFLGRIFGAVLFHGARTGRYVGRGFQPQNLPKPSVKYESIDELIYDLVTMTNEAINEKYGSFMKAASSAVRGMIKAPDGRMLYGADYAAIEARIVFWLADCMRGLKMYNIGKDLYIDAATGIYGLNYEDVGKDSDERWMGKQVILGCGYGLGWKGFVNSCAQWGVTVSEQLARDAVDTYRGRYSEVPELWKDMDKASLRAVRTGQLTSAANGKIYFKTFKFRNGQRYLLMKLPSGRSMMYPSVRIKPKKTPWGQVRDSIFYRAMENNVWGWTDTYGGKLVENACQSIARDVMMEGMANAANAGASPLIQVHDELISEVDPTKMSLDEYEQLLCSPMPEWAKTIPLKAEGKELTRYQKL